MCPASPISDPAPPRLPARWWQGLRAMPLVGCSMLVAYLQFRPDPSLPSVPKPLGGMRDYFDIHDFSKNAFGFAVLALTMHVAFDRGSSDRPGRRTVVLAAVIVLLEVAQLALPTRTCDWRDVAAGWMGIVLMDVSWRGLRRFRHGR